MSKQANSHSYGQKIKRSKNLYGKKKGPFRRTFEIIGMAVVIVGLGLVGYAAGKPLAEFLNGSGDIITSDTLKWTPPEESEIITSQATNTAAETTEEEAEEVMSVKDETEVKAVFAPSSALDNTSSLAAYVNLAKNNGFNTVVLELKDNTGNLLFKSGISYIQDKPLIKGTLTANDIATVFKDSGVKPVARINTLKDHMGTKSVENFSYRFADGSYNWADARIEDGGRTWANPFLDGTRGYLSDIVAELASAGFSDIILSGFIFPSFSPYDIGILSSQVTDVNTRHSALTELLSICYGKKGQSNIILEISLKDAVENYGGYKNTAEILRGKNNLKTDGIIITFNRAEIGSELITGESSSVKLPADLNELASMLYKQAARGVGDIKIIPCIDNNGLSDEEIVNLEEQLKNLGYNSIMIK